jgi:hypothetical protein
MGREGTRAHTERNKMTRYDFDETTRRALNSAVSLNIIDAVELGCIMAAHGTDVAAILAEITEAGWADRHSPESADARRAWCSILDGQAAACPSVGSLVRFQYP